MPTLVICTRFVSILVLALSFCSEDFSTWHYPTSMPTSYIDRTTSAVGQDPMYDVLHRGPTSGRLVGLRRKVRRLGADVGPTHRHSTSGTMVGADVEPMHRQPTSRTMVGSQRRADASAPTSCTTEEFQRLADASALTERISAYVSRGRRVADAWPTCGRRLADVWRLQSCTQ